MASGRPRREAAGQATSAARAGQTCYIVAANAGGALRVSARRLEGSHMAKIATLLLAAALLVISILVLCQVTSP